MQKYLFNFSTAWLVFAWRNWLCIAHSLWSHLHVPHLSIRRGPSRLYLLNQGLIQHKGNTEIDHVSDLRQTQKSNQRKTSPPEVSLILKNCLGTTHLNTTVDSNYIVTPLFTQLSVLLKIHWFSRYSYISAWQWKKFNNTYTVLTILSKPCNQKSVLLVFITQVTSRSLVREPIKIKTTSYEHACA